MRAPLPKKTDSPNTRGTDLPAKIFVNKYPIFGDDEDNDDLMQK
jgi:hypothetical protein